MSGHRVTRPPRFTLDSNILIYAADRSEPIRQAAVRVIAAFNRRGGISAAALALL
jgi:predicted nucleic acid-binding protein